MNPGSLQKKGRGYILWNYCLIKLSRFVTHLNFMVLYSWGNGTLSDHRIHPNRTLHPHNKIGNNAKKVTEILLLSLETLLFVSNDMQLLQISHSPCFQGMDNRYLSGQYKVLVKSAEEWLARWHSSAVQPTKRSCFQRRPPSG